MTARSMTIGVAATAAIGAAAAGLTAFAGGASSDARLQQVVFDAPLEPAPPVPPPVEPGVPAAPEPGAPAAPEAAPAQGAPLPTPQEVSGMLTQLSDAGVGYKEKSHLVENGISPEEGHGLDHELRKDYRDGELPYTFDVQNVAPTGPGQALATVTISGPKTPAQTTPLQLVDQGSGWVLSHDSATQLFRALAQP